MIEDNELTKRLNADNRDLRKKLYQKEEIIKELEDRIEYNSEEKKLFKMRLKNIEESGRNYEDKLKKLKEREIELELEIIRSELRFAVESKKELKDLVSLVFNNAQIKESVVKKTTDAFDLKGETVIINKEISHD